MNLVTITSLPQPLISVGDIVYEVVTFNANDFLVSLLFPHQTFLHAQDIIKYQSTDPSTEAWLGYNNT